MQPVCDCHTNVLGEFLGVAEATVRSIKSTVFCFISVCVLACVLCGFTLSAEVPKSPNVFMMSPCESSSGSLLVGCLATGFSPAESVNFKWMDQRGNSLTNFIQYPTVVTGNKLMKVSHITINEAEWNQSKIICEARHPSRNVNETFITGNNRQ